VIDTASSFRASGRFLWPVAYARMLGSVAALARWTPPKVAIPVLLIAAVLQFGELRYQVATLRPALAAPATALIDEATVRTWMQGHRRLFQFPSWSCGGLGSGRKEDAVVDSFRALQLNLLAARMHLATNTVYTSRHVKDCSAEALWPIRAALGRGVLYLINKGDAPRTPALTRLVQSPACVDAGWAMVCSRTALQPPGAGPLEAGKEAAISR
jgi:hypothetical protein